MPYEKQRRCEIYFNRRDTVKGSVVCLRQKSRFMRNPSEETLFADVIPRSPQKDAWREFICSLNFLLCILGYPLIMALLSPFGSGLESGENVYFTYPYRIFQMLVAVLAFIAVRSNPMPKFSWKLFLLTVFWILFFSRAFWSLFVDAPVIEQGNLWYYRCYLVIDTFPLLAVLKGWNNIDFRKVLKWALLLGVVGLAFASRSISMQAEESWTGEIGRAGASRMLHTQALGHFSAAIILLAIYMFFVEKGKFLWKIFSAFAVLLGFYVMLKAGSRGPLLAVAFAGTLWFGVKRKNILVIVFLWALCIGLIFLFQEQLVDLIREISPTMADRVSSTLESGDTSGRDVLWAECWEECKRNPLFGYSYTAFGYPHNMFLDGFMMFGMFGGWIIAILILVGFFSSLKFLHKARADYWWVLLLLASLSQAWTQSGFSALAIQASLFLLFIQENMRNHEITSNPPLRQTNDF